MGEGVLDVKTGQFCCSSQNINKKREQRKVGDVRTPTGSCVPSKNEYLSATTKDTQQGSGEAASLVNFSNPGITRHKDTAQEN